MYKYDQIVDSKLSIEFNKKCNDDMNTFVEHKLPIEFFDLYKTEMKEINELVTLYRSLSKELIISILYPSMDMYDIYKQVIYLYDQVEKSEYLKLLYNKISCLTNIDMECILTDVFSIIMLFKKLYPDRVDYLNNLDKRLVDLQEYLYHTDKIVVVKDHNYVDIPNAWYITKSGVLYNTMGFEDGHKESNLQYPIRDIRLDLLAGRKIDDKSEQYLEEYHRIDELGYITDVQFFDYLNLCGKLDLVYKNRIYNEDIVKLVKGIIMAHVELYKEFSKFNDMDNKGKNYVRLMKLTNYSLDDIFVRFLGFSKVNVSGTKAICTSSRDDNKFSEYFEHNHYLDYVNPIEVKDGIIQERDLSEFDVIRRVLKQ